VTTYLQSKNFFIYSDYKIFGGQEMKFLSIILLIAFSSLANSSDHLNIVNPFMGLWQGSGQMLSSVYIQDPNYSSKCDAIANLVLSSERDTSGNERKLLTAKLVLDCGYAYKPTKEWTFYVNKDMTLESISYFSGLGKGEKGIFMRNFLKLTYGPVGRAETMTFQIIDKDNSDSGMLLVNTTFGKFLLKKI
jgi:hypothetical protein